MNWSAVGDALLDFFSFAIWFVVQAIRRIGDILSWMVQSRRNFLIVCIPVVLVLLVVNHSVGARIGSGLAKFFLGLFGSFFEVIYQALPSSKQIISWLDNGEDLLAELVTALLVILVIWWGAKAILKGVRK